MGILGEVKFITKNVASANEFDNFTVVINDPAVDDGVKAPATNAAGLANQPVGVTYDGSVSGDTACTVMPLHSSTQPAIYLAEDTSAGELSYSVASGEVGLGKAAASTEWVIGLLRKDGKAGELVGFDAVEPYVKA